MGSNFQLNSGFHGKAKKREVKARNNEANENDKERRKEKMEGKEEFTGEYQYAGFLERFLALLIDSFILSTIISAGIFALFGSTDVEEMLVDGLTGISAVIYTFLTFIFPALYSILLWMKYGGTPGKLILGIKVVNEETGENLGLIRSIVRYIGYLISFIPFLIGYFWAIIDGKNRTWHDMIAGSVVIKNK